MLTILKRQWQGLQHGVPGHRFQARYTSARRHPGPAWLRAVRIGAALVLIAVGAIFAVIPGPAVVFFALAGALLAAESRVVARALDWSELRGRELWHWGHRHWKRFGLPSRIAIVALGVSCGAGASLLAWNFLSR